MFLGPLEKISERKGVPKSAVRSPYRPLRPFRCPSFPTNAIRLMVLPLLNYRSCSTEPLHTVNPVLLPGIRERLLHTRYEYAESLVSHAGRHQDHPGVRAALAGCSRFSTSCECSSSPRKRAQKILLVSVKARCLLRPMTTPKDSPGSDAPPHHSPERVGQDNEVEQLD
jgi:hypothetical protein